MLAHYREGRTQPSTFADTAANGPRGARKFIFPSAPDPKFKKETDSC